MSRRRIPRRLGVEVPKEGEKRVLFSQSFRGLARRQLGQRILEAGLRREGAARWAGLGSPVGQDDRGQPILVGRASGGGR